MSQKTNRSKRVRLEGVNTAATRRQFLQAGAAGAGVLFFSWNRNRQAYAVPIPGGTLDPTTIPKYQAPLVIPPAMPRSGRIVDKGKGKDKGKGNRGPSGDYYEIAVRQFQQQILPPGLPPTTVWSYGSLRFPGTVGQGGTFNYPAFTIEAGWNTPVRVNWVNDLVDGNGDFLPHLLPVDQTLHWANPVGPRDTTGSDPSPYVGPVPLVTHVHGAHTFQESDGYPEAWYLPAAANIPAEFASTGTYYDIFRDLSPLGLDWAPGSAVFEYPNDQRATTLWYHDHTLGITRLNVYSGPAGFYLIRGGPNDEVLGIDGKRAILPGPAPSPGDPMGMDYYEIPIVIQDRSFNLDGTLFYPDNRAFFEGLDPAQLQIPFIPDPACDGLPSDVSAIWQPEFFGNVMVVNGVSWPFLDVAQRRYRFRFLNGCNSRFLILKFDHPDVEVWQIGADGGFLSAPVDVNAVNGGMLLLAPAERADLIVDFSKVSSGTHLLLANFGPDEPFGAGVPGVDFDLPDPETTGQVMQFRVVPSKGRDRSTPPAELVLPPVAPPVPGLNPRVLTLVEEKSRTVRVVENDGNVVLACDDENALPFGPVAALLGDNTGASLWHDEVTENPVAGTTETWEIYNSTAVAHPIHIHLVQFQVLDRQPVGGGPVRPPMAGETSFKDTVIAFPGEITRVQALFDTPGRFVWHCHIVEHEDNEMMRPFDVL